MANTETSLKTIVGLYDQLSQARDAMAELTQAGVQRDSINLVAHASAEEYGRYFDGEGKYQDAPSGAVSSIATGAGAGAILGGIGGLVVGLSLIPIPGIGPIIAAGPLASAMAGAGIGAVVGGLIGGLTSIGVDEEHAGYYAEGVRRGGSLLVVKTDSHMQSRVTQILKRHEPVDIEQRVSRWRESGFTTYDSKQPAYDYDQIARERERYMSIPPRMM